MVTTLALIILAVVGASRAWANTMPTKVLGGPTGALLPGRETAVGVVEERLFFDFVGEKDRKENGYIPVVVWPRVTVEYVLHNPSPPRGTIPTY